MNIKEFYQYAAEKLKNSGIETPAPEAGVILCHVLNCSRTYLYTNNERVLHKDELEELETYLQKRAANVPLQYLLGETEFMSLTFAVSPAVLIPRQDTEILVEKCIELLRDRIKSHNKEENSHGQHVRVLDMCTGSGCIAVSIVHYCPESRGVACDVSLSALEVAKSNSERAGVQKRLEFRCGDLFEALDGEERFELIVSNPPYIETETVKGLQTEVRDHEPYIALDGGADGLDFYRKIVSAAPGYLSRGGYLALEIGYNQAESVSKLMEPHFEHVTVLKDLGGNDRVVFGKI
ncbi:MAG: protein-(glutamine-N5) methyltransferase, release factor-specific [Eubacterium sp.]|jgi:release factor glutamine methyltransferase|nr:protein-(glutamine-N5) methyltransferase, release factor-specific [Eubacterium sp.]